MLNGKAAVRPLPAGLDPLALYVDLTEARPDTMLFERQDGTSLILSKAALRIACRGRDVTVTGLTDQASPVLRTLEAELGDWLAARTDTFLSFRFPPVSQTDAAERLQAPSPFDVLRTLAAGAIDGDPFGRTLLGVIAFDHVDFLEDLPANEEDPLDFPDLLFWLAEELIVIEPDGSARAVCSSAERLDEIVQLCGSVPALAEPLAPAQADFGSVDIDDDRYCRIVGAMKEHIRAGDVYQIVPSRTFRSPCVDPVAALAAQRREDPSPYQFYVAAPDHVLFGCSPEASVRVSSAGDIEVKPIAGTRPRGETADEDDRLEAELRLDAKEVAEHMMLVDLARNDVARVSQPGTRRVAALLGVERYARVMHLVSSVKGRMRDGLDSLHALHACLNVGTLVGAPKIRATEILRQTERTKRGPYGGAVGWISGTGAMDTGVVIRSAIVKDGTAYVRAGAGIVFDSDPAAEADETKRKASALLSVLAGQAAR